MKQYFVEVPDEAKIVESTNTLIFDAAPATERTCKRVKGMTLYTETSVKIVADENLKRGHEEAWELAKKIANPPLAGGFTVEELDGIFGTQYVSPILRNHTYDEAIQKVQTWEEEKKAIHAGDIVLDANGNKSVVTRIGDPICTVMCADGSIGFYTQSELIKTGKTVDISAILSQIKEA